MEDKLGRPDEGKMIKIFIHFHTDKIPNNENGKKAQINGKVFTKKTHKEVLTQQNLKISIISENCLKQS